MDEIVWGPGSSFDDGWWREVYRLYDTAWPALSERIAQVTALGWPWPAHTTSFVRLAGGAPVAHVGVLAHPVRWNGRDRVVAGIHAVCTHPEHRGRGHALALLKAATAFIDERYDLAKLHTHQPELYAKVGFEELPTFTFEASHRGGGGPARPLDLRDAAQLAALHAAMAQRQPISDRFCSLDPGWLVGTDAGLSRNLERWFHQVPGASWIGVYEHRDDALIVHDLLGAELPSLQELLSSVAEPFQKVIWTFCPDKLDPSAVAVPVPREVGVFQTRGRRPEAGPIGISAAWEH